MNIPVTKLFYYSWYQDFYAAISPRQIYETDWLLEKWNQTLFIYKMEAEMFPSYHFWSVIDYFLSLIFPSKPYLEIDQKRFSAAPEDYLREKLVECVSGWRFLPQIFRDLYTFYPKYDLTFSEVEFVYLDYYFQLPKVFASLLSELLIRDDPFRDFIPASPDLFTPKLIALSKELYQQEATFPANLADKLSKEALHLHVIEFFSGDDPEKCFLKVINLYLNSRLSIKAQCTLDLQAKGLEVNDLSLAEYFLGYYIFKGVSNEGLRFCVANSNLENKNPFKKYREYSVKVWNSFSKERQEKIINREKKGLEELRAKVNRRASMTHEEKVAEREAFLKRLDDPNDPEYGVNAKVGMISVSELFPKGNKS